MEADIRLWQKTLIFEKELKCSVQSRVDLIRDSALGVQYIYRENRGKDDVYRKMMTLRCGNLPKILDVREQNGNTVVLEEFINGDRLDQLLDAGPLTPEQAHSIAVQICDALTALHGIGAVHRDVKPENILICGQQAVLIDFDASRICKEGQASDTQIMGTNGYAAPEQYGFSQTDARTDLYALGIVLNEMLTGKHPSTRLADKPFRAVVEKCISINADQRYTSAEELKAALFSIFPAKKKKKRLWPWVTAALIAAFLGGMVSGRLVPGKAAQMQEEPASLAHEEENASEISEIQEELALYADYNEDASESTMYICINPGGNMEKFLFRKVDGQYLKLDASYRVYSDDDELTVERMVSGRFFIQCYKIPFGERRYIKAEKDGVVYLLECFIQV